MTEIIFGVCLVSTFVIGHYSGRRWEERFYKNMLASELKKEGLDHTLKSLERVLRDIDSE